MTFDSGHPCEPHTGRHTLADLVAAVPYLVGFYPEDSLVLLSTRSPGGLGVEFTVRVDLPPPREAAEAADELARLMGNHRCHDLVLAVVGGAVPGTPEQPERCPPPRLDVATTLVRACTSAGIHVWAAVWVAELAEGAPWRCYGGCGCSGVLPDPASTPAAAAAVAGGLVTYTDRAELERVVAEGDPAVLRRRATLVQRRLDALIPPAPPPPARRREALALVRRWVDQAGGAGPALGDEDVVGLCLALSDPLIRDAALGLAYTANTAAAAERLWTTLVGEAPDPLAAEPAVLLAHSALVRGDGALTGVALARAQRAWPGHRLSALFLAALDAGCGPDQLRAWFMTGYRRAMRELTR